ncbi:MAG: copper transporter [Bifidobacteriaceae bacterium]|jgi:hypothetical protein|nr:copper transporter [Bifidobacteriaceae bacterium]
MINFRYHLVSLICVFLALAVGIVLGAGSLRDPITSNLDAQVTSLRDEKDSLREELAVAESDGEYRDGILETLVPLGVDAMLPDTQVALVSVGSVDGRVEATFAEALRDAGASIATRLTIEETWWQAGSQDLHRAASPLAEAGGMAPPVGPLSLDESPLADVGVRDDDVVVASTIVAAVVAGRVDGTGSVSRSGAGGSGQGFGSGVGGIDDQPDHVDGAGAEAGRDSGGGEEDPGASAGDLAAGGQEDALGAGGEVSDGIGGTQEITGTVAGATSEERLEALERTGLVDVKALGTPAEALVIVLADEFARRDADEADPRWEREDQAVLSLIAAAGGASAGAVVVGPADVDVDVLARARGDRAIEASLSTVDGSSTPALALACVWALAADLQGVNGHVGPGASVSGGSLLGPRMPLTAPRRTDRASGATSDADGAGTGGGDPTPDAT